MSNRSQNRQLEANLGPSATSGGNSMKVEASARNSSVFFDYIERRVKHFPNYVLRLEAQSEEDARLLKDLFGDEFHGNSVSLM